MSLDGCCHYGQRLHSFHLHHGIHLLLHSAHSTHRKTDCTYTPKVKRSRVQVRRVIGCQICQNGHTDFGACLPKAPEIREIFFGQLSSKIRHFVIFFIRIFSGKKCLGPNISHCLYFNSSSLTIFVLFCWSQSVLYCCAFQDFMKQKYLCLCRCACVCLQGSYPNAKKLNLTEFELVPDRHFNNIPVNLVQSTVHVPTNVYDNCNYIHSLSLHTALLNYAFNCLRSVIKSDQSSETWIVPTT